MKTRITEGFGIRYPIVLSGMSWISVPRLVAAVSQAGGLGILATGVLNAEQTRRAVREVRALTDRPFGANVTLYFPGARDNARVLLEEQVPVINVSLVDLTLQLKRETSAEEVNALLKAASEKSPVLGYNALPLVSCDFNHNPLSSIFDANHTKVSGKLLKVMAWYDNEWGFSNRMLDNCLTLARLG